MISLSPYLGDVVRDSVTGALNLLRDHRPHVGLALFTHVSLQSKHTLNR
jgi:hypothetical protein